MIRKPFLFEGALLGFASCASALLITALGLHGIGQFLANELSFLQLSGSLQFFPPSIVLASLATSAALGLAASHIGLSRINDGWAASGRSQ